jgi:NAD(P)-dependent dehydrogenase (short-subunit alcohol dehydrogenase family)
MLSDTSEGLPGESLGLGGRVAIVTGGSRGIGRTILERLSELGARVASLDITAPIAVHKDALHVACDVTDEASVATAVGVVTDKFGSPTILVNNAGVTQGFEPAEMTSQEWDRFFALDLKAAWLCAREVLPAMRAARLGAIVNVASIHATLTTTGVFPYAAAKSGLVGLTRSLGLEVARDGIRVNAVCPGLIETEAVRERVASEPAFAAGIRDLPLGRMGQPREIAELVAFLASERSSFIVAAAIPIDGGVSARLSSI